MPSILINDADLKKIQTLGHLLIESNPADDVLSEALAFLQKIKVEQNTPLHMVHRFLSNFLYLSILCLMQWQLTTDPESNQNQFIVHKQSDTDLMLASIFLYQQLKTLLTLYSLQKKLPKISEYYHDLHNALTDYSFLKYFKSKNILISDHSFNLLLESNLENLSADKIFTLYKKIFGEIILNLKCIDVSTAEFQRIREVVEKLSNSNPTEQAKIEARNYLNTVKKTYFPTTRDPVTTIGLLILCTLVTLGNFTNQHSEGVAFLAAVAFSLSMSMMLYFPAMKNMYRQGLNFFTSTSKQHQTIQFEADITILQNCTIERLSSAELIALFNKVYGAERLNQSCVPREIQLSALSN